MPTKLVGPMTQEEGLSHFRDNGMARFVVVSHFEGEVLIGGLMNEVLRGTAAQMRILAEKILAACDQADESEVSHE